MTNSSPISHVKPHLLQLPYELRLRIYTILFPAHGSITISNSAGPSQSKPSWTYAAIGHLPAVCRQLFQEFHAIFLPRTTSFSIIEIDHADCFTRFFPWCFARYIKTVTISFLTGTYSHFRLGTLCDLEQLESVTIYNANPSYTYGRRAFDEFVSGTRNIGELWWWRRPHFCVEDDKGKPETWRSYENVKVLYTVTVTTDEMAVIKGGSGRGNRSVIRYEHDLLTATFDARNGELVAKETDWKERTKGKIATLAREVEREGETQKNGNQPS